VTGNTWDWTSSLYKSCPYSAKDGREDPVTTGARRVVRGGSWDRVQVSVHASSRASRDPDGRPGVVGLRVVRSFPSLAYNLSTAGRVSGHGARVAHCVIFFTACAVEGGERCGTTASPAGIYQGTDYWEYGGLRKEAFIHVMAPNPKPRHGTPFQKAKGSIAPRYAHRPNILLVVDTLKTQRRMEGVVSPQLISFPGTTLNIFRP
jgi:hypothetical protein